MKSTIQSGCIQKRQSRKWKRAKNIKRESFETFGNLAKGKVQKKGRKVDKKINPLRSFLNIAHG